MRFDFARHAIFESWSAFLYHIFGAFMGRPLISISASMPGPFLAAWTNLPQLSWVLSNRVYGI